ncbi:hypothetical protein ASPWEDRAFT_554745 [Aspergillus wentii DTO 134E9]|uniref:C2H2-type domain-containing protein n=1 Tax=Aspergillus wentii DTO 134E9 TaxID=1073089 RepID=A0A1L9RGJ5_ASPWE|nr:uncharacterized protein ASPWEDRAFT_554745 [Aspergillus wentii DTO 134E9]KAI9927809.1 copper-binding transcription factor [Aspergillus wentii]OJJ34024.1 hypothetical protein ASPWEDRAFT_554745 [Aspergillus wentii DTO 134E9]
MSAPQAEQPRVHPRRRPLKNAPPSLSTSSSPENHLPCRPEVRLRKGETFHSSSTPPSDDRDPVLSFRSLPRRSPTCPKSLEAIAAGEQRMADILGRLSLNSPGSSDSNEGQPGDDLPVPRGFLQAHIDSNTAMEKHSKRTSTPPLAPPAKARKSHYHASDSGLGTSVSSSQAMSASNNSKVKAGQVSFEHLESGSSSAQGTQSAITSSISGPEAQDKRQLNWAACKQIERFILVPILKEERLKPFHPLVQSVPQRIVDKEIGCLRDLEKTLLWLAPQHAVSRASYLGFCEFTIQCLHTSVHHLHERDQRLPTDRPYTNGYFLDLVAQIRNYAAMINASRNSSRVARGSPQPGEKASASERITLEGGLSKTGRPAELVAHKDGQSVSLRTGQPYDENALPAFKRSLSVESLDEGVERSMARRKKNAPPMDINQKCKDCDKVFKRPCDLTKHEKTHSRPWKCSEPTCKYYGLGWPTEKERDRHMNDKHSKAPALFRCNFEPCTYQSKRESNCKQHMEKAHGWVYVRSKNNGRSGRKGSARATPSTPSISTPASKAVSTPASGPTNSPFDMGYPQDPPFSFADPPTRTGGDDFPLFSESNSYEDPSVGINGFSFNFDAFQNQLEAGDPNGLIPLDMSNRQSFDNTSVPDLMGSSMGFENSPNASTDNNSLNFDLDWGHLDTASFDDEFTAMNMQLLTPAHSVEARGMNSFSRDPSISNPSPLSFQQGKVALYSPSSCQFEENAHDLYEAGYNGPKTGNDFTLYEHNATMGAGGAMNMSNGNHMGLRNLNQMFPPLSTQESVGYMNQQWAPHHPIPNDMDLEFL